MFFNDIEDLQIITRNAQTVILKLFDGIKIRDKTFSLENFAKNLKAIIIEPEDNKIKIEQVRSVIDTCNAKQTTDRFYIFNRAETMTTNAANSLLKLLEEPLENYHFILITTNPGAILPTIRSRSMLYTPKIETPLDNPPVASEEILTLAKTLLTAKSTQIPEIVEKFAKKKEDVRREFTLKTLETAVELAEKSYFKTGNPLFATKLENLIAAHSGVKQNGNLKLQLIANLI